MSISPERRQAYVSVRREIVRHLPVIDGPVIDVGCAAGGLGGYIKQRWPGHEVVGIERDRDLAQEAEQRVDRVLVEDAVEGLRQLRREGLRPALVVFADVLEHLVDPWAAFDAAAEMAMPGGYILVSVPNIAFWSTHVHLLRERWPYNERGLYDDSHLRFFARRNVVDLCDRGPARLERLHRTYRFVDRRTMLNRLAVLVAPLLRPLVTYQFIAVAQVSSVRAET